MDPNTPVMSLADLAGINLNDYEAVRFENIPEMLAQFEVSDVKIEKVDFGETMRGPAAQYEFTVKECFGTTNPDLKKEEMVGKKQRQNFMLRNAEDIGRYRAFLEDCGVGIEGTPPLPDLIMATKGMLFVGKSVHTKNKNDPDKPYCNVRPKTQKEEQAAA